ncbi:hypothetical protein ACPC54_41225 [Kitasatospora sp. NPDC094028]
MYVYGCGVCRTVSHHASADEVFEERDGHRLKVHHGRVPMGEWIRDDTPPPAPPSAASVARWMLGTWPGRAAALLLVVVVVRVGFFLGGLPPLFAPAPPASSPSSVLPLFAPVPSASSSAPAGTLPVVGGAGTGTAP